MIPAVTKVVLHTDRVKAEGEARQFSDQYSWSYGTAKSRILPSLGNKSGQHA